MVYSNTEVGEDKEQPVVSSPVNAGFATASLENNCWKKAIR